MHDRAISKSKSKIIKMIAVALMVVHHLFAFPSRIQRVSYKFIWDVNGIPIEQILGLAGSICVPIFLFLSGYGLYIVYGDKVTYREIKHRIINLYKNYWIIFFMFIPLGILRGVYVFNAKEFILNTLALRSIYNEEWWFLRLYISLMLLYPIILKIVNKFNKNKVLFISFILNIIGFELNKILIILGIDLISTNIVVIVLSGQFMFVLGIIVCKYSLFDKLNNKIKYSYWQNNLSLITISFLIIITLNIASIADIAKLILTPIFIFFLNNIISENFKWNMFSNHLTNIWLIHSFFCYYLFQRLVFAFRYSLLIFLCTVILSWICSIVINRILIIINKICLLNNYANTAKNILYK